ncbi:U3 snoRNP protein [Gonapodya sp. JEL0774]|nr:U3 snoRNP protein [Gonapodya sp. JEL0774]
MPTLLPTPIPAALKAKPSILRPHSSSGSASKKTRKRKPKKSSTVPSIATLLAETRNADGEIDERFEKDAEELELERAVFGAAAEGAMESFLALAGKEFETGDARTSGLKRRFDSGDREDEADMGDKVDAEEGDEFSKGDFDALGFVIDARPTNGVADPDSDEEMTDHRDTDVHDRLMTIDTNSDEDDEADKGEPVSKNDKGQQRKSAWHDPDDERLHVNIADIKRARKLRKNERETVIDGVEYARRLREQFERLHPRPTWALPQAVRAKMGLPTFGTDSTVPDSEGDGLESAEVRLFSSSKSLVADRVSRRAGVLPPEILEVVRAKDANQMAHGREVIATGRRRHLYTYDVEAGKVERIAGIKGREADRSLESFVMGGVADQPLMMILGRDGYLTLVDGKTKQWIGDLKMNGTVAAAEFSADGKRIFSIGGDGVVYAWDVGSRRCIHTFVDEGTIKPTSIAVSPNDQVLATGNNAGIVNIYNLSSALANPRPQPLKAVGNLTTSISGLSFSPTSEMLAISSRTKKDSFRVLHVASRTVFQNWPTFGTPLGHVTSHEFSPGSGYLTVGNDRGKALLYRLGHYEIL